jgi:carbamoylphosphate synthase large subunit
LAEAVSLLRYWRFLQGVLAVRLKILVIHLRDVRTFFRFPRQLKFEANARGRWVILYGIPYADWNATLSDRELWSRMQGVAQVLRLPATGLGSGARADDVVIAMKTSHIVRRPGGRALEPTPRAVATLEDKAKFAAYMAVNGFGDYCPRTYAGRHEAVFPCMLKRTDLSASLGVAIAQSAEHLDELLQTRTFQGHRCLLQALVQGNVEYATYCVCKDGRVLWSCSFATDIGSPIAIKREDNAVRRQAIATPDPVLRQIEAVLLPLAFSGPCNVDYKLLADGRMQIFEINPRLGGTLMLPAQAAELRAALACIIEHATA